MFAVACWITLGLMGSVVVERFHSQITSCLRQLKIVAEVAIPTILALALLYQLASLVVSDLRR
jgi:hypothetical protein